ncbi:MFS transporter [Microbacterium sp. ASV49]|uniref:MFS transporter n=1 Tax=Microbacterium candidum TaxID=3041922 RepID=A0ABT7N0L9_9MICO|nr:MFS transporter [Microbacterium sp. ASV49]MDL9980253.1 MFS transporter [Microbacterium sp. ASV49]
MTTSQRSDRDQDSATRTRRASRFAVTTAYAAQALGYAVLVTSLPALEKRQHIDDQTVSLIMLGVAVVAALGSVLADLISVRWGSRAALATGLIIEAAILPVVAFQTPLAVFIGALAIYGLGLGCVDAASSMQGVLVQRSYGRPLMGGFFAGYTAAAIVGALLVSGVAASAAGAGVAITVAAVVFLAVALVGMRLFARDVPVDEALPKAERGKLPRAGIWAFGLVILAVFVVDSSVSTWGTVYLQNNLKTLAWIAPLGYAAYQVCILITRLVTDRLMPRIGRVRLVLIATLVSAVGCFLVALLPFEIAAIVGFALAGVATGVLVPVTFGAAGELDPAHSDQIIARVNIFNYAGVIVGAVLLGLLSGGPNLGFGFLIPAVVLLAVLFVLRWFRTRPASPAAADTASVTR